MGEGANFSGGFVPYFPWILLHASLIVAPMRRDLMSRGLAATEREVPAAAGGRCANGCRAQ
jgi:hypothetical protein